MITAKVTPRADAQEKASLLHVVKNARREALMAKTDLKQLWIEYGNPETGPKRRSELRKQLERQFDLFGKHYYLQRGNVAEGWRRNEWESPSDIANLSPLNPATFTTMLLTTNAGFINDKLRRFGQGVLLVPNAIGGFPYGAILQKHITLLFKGEEKEVPRFALIKTATQYAYKLHAEPRTPELTLPETERKILQDELRRKGSGITVIIIDDLTTTGSALKVIGDELTRIGFDPDRLYQIAMNRFIENNGGLEKWTGNVTNSTWRK